MQTRTKKGIMYASLLAAMSTSPLLLASRQANAESLTFDVEPRNGPVSLVTTWTNVVSLSGSTSTWDSYCFYYVFGGNITVVIPIDGPNDGSSYTGGTHTAGGGSGIVITPPNNPFFETSGTYFCYADDWGTGDGHSTWFHNLGWVQVTIS